MTASNNSLHKIIIYMSLSYTHPIFNQVHLATASVWKPTETGGFCISKVWDVIKSNIKHHKTRLQTHHYLHSIQIIWEQKNSNFRTCSKDRILSGARMVFPWGRILTNSSKVNPLLTHRKSSLIFLLLATLDQAGLAVKGTFGWLETIHFSRLPQVKAHKS